MHWLAWTSLVIAILLLLTMVHDVTQRHRAILRNFPVVGHLRFLLEAIGPELRQYIVTSNDDERPFSRDQRRWIYSSAKSQNTYFGFGTDNDLDRSPGYISIKQSMFPVLADGHRRAAGGSNHPLPSAKVLGGARERPGAFRLQSVVNISSMSYGSLSAAAVEALNRGAELAGCLQGTGEGGVSDHHRHGGELMWQIGTGYFGCRDHDGAFSLDAFREQIDTTPQIRAIEIKLSQGAKPGMGGLLPAAKVTPEIARVRGIPEGVDCVSPAGHSAFRDADSLLDFVELLAETSGLPVGIKSAVGDDRFFDELAELMIPRDRGVDFVTIDGGEGGTGAAPLSFSDHVALPFKVGFSRVQASFARRDLTEQVVFIGSGRLGLPHHALLAFALGCDAVNVAREAMLAIGCIQSQRCHTGRCPTGVATNDWWRMRGLDPTLKSVRAAAYLDQLRKELLQLSHACGVEHPSLVTAEQIELLDDMFGSRTVAEVFGYEAGWGSPSIADREHVAEVMVGLRTSQRR